jgi:sec-independent protein translocase protein TatC
MNFINKNKQATVLNRSWLVFLLELRLRFLYCLTVFLGVLGLLLPFAHYWYQCLAQPLLSQLPANSHFISTTLTAPLFIPIKFTANFAIFISMPFMLHQFWLFVSPALYVRERYLARLILLLSWILFYSGVYLAYQFILPFLIGFFLRTTPHYIHIFPDIGHYLDLALQLMVDFGLIFEVPLLIIVGVVSGFLNVKTLSSWRRYFIVLSFIIAMFLTPPDVISQILLAIPLCLLFEIGLLGCHFIPKSAYVEKLQK